MLVVGFPTGAFQANCYLLAAGAEAECVIVDPGQDAALRISDLTHSTKVLTLSDEVVALPGHGPSTTIGQERTANPFLAGVSEMT